MGGESAQKTSGEDRSSRRPRQMPEGQKGEGREDE
jgi:hypothetical protein